IAQKDELLVFIEVKWRKIVPFDIGEVITATKQKKIIQVAQDYIARHALHSMLCRFDVALIKGHSMKIEYIENAFQAPDDL
ncbi:MAG: YraN family protein, partial [Candidatus Babeliales bacterium]